jgi:hypothetical protein
MPPARQIPRTGRPRHDGSERACGLSVDRATIHANGATSCTSPPTSRITMAHSLRRPPVASPSRYQVTNAANFPGCTSRSLGTCVLVTRRTYRFVLRLSLPSIANPKIPQSMANAGRVWLATTRHPQPPESLVSFELVGALVPAVEGVPPEVGCAVTPPVPRLPPMPNEPAAVLVWLVLVTPPVLEGIPPAVFELPPAEALPPTALTKPEAPPVFGRMLVEPPTAVDPPAGETPPVALAPAVALFPPVALLPPVALVPPAVVPPALEDPPAPAPPLPPTPVSASKLAPLNGTTTTLLP